MKQTLITLLFCASFLIGCTGYEEDISQPVDIQQEADITDDVTVIANDVTSAEIDNILKSLYGERVASRDAEYETTIIKDKDGNDCIIKIDFANDKGFTLLSATKTHEPILAYSDQGNFNGIDALPFPLNEWFEQTIEDISNSFNLPLILFRRFPESGNFMKPAKKLFLEIRTMTTADWPTSARLK